MSASHLYSRTRRRRAALITTITLTAATAIAVLPGSGQGQQSITPSGGWPVTGLPVTDLRPVGAPALRPGEVLGVGVLSGVLSSPEEPKSRAALVVQKDEGGWQFVSGVVGAGGTPVEQWNMLEGSGRVTPSGGMAVAADGRIYARKPGDPLKALPAPDASLLGSLTLVGSRRVTMAPFDIPGTGTGVLAAPVGKVEDRVLFHDGTGWTTEAINIAGAPTSFKVAAIVAPSSDSAWLVADGGAGVEIYRRDTSSPGAVDWEPVSLTGAPSFVATDRARPLAFPAEGLTAVENALWLDGVETVSGSPRAFSLRIDISSASSPRVQRAWCADDASPGSPCPADLGVELAVPPAPDVETGAVSEGVGTGYRSFAWGGSGFGSRVITNPKDRDLPSAAGQGYVLFDGSSFSAIRAGAPSDTPAIDGAFTAPTHGWLVYDDPTVLRIAPAAPAPRLQAYPVPTRRPLLSVAAEPGRSPADPGAKALAVGDNGRVLRYDPAAGWTVEQLTTSSGRATPRLSGVAWPEAGRAHAVGEQGEMWIWRAETGLWERDDTAPDDLIADRFTGIAFEPGNPDRGYAVTSSGRILAFSKGWEEQAVPTLNLQQDRLMGIAFAGGEAMVAARGRLLVNDGGGWREETQVTDLLEKQPAGVNLLAVAGLPDGGAVAAGRGVVLVRDRAGAPWRLGDHQLSGDIVAVQAVRDGDRVRAVAIVGDGQSGAQFQVDEDDIEDPSRPPLQRPEPGVDGFGTLLRETAGGWVDDERATYQLGATVVRDCPYVPDAARAMALDANGEGWIVGGDLTGSARGCRGRSGEGLASEQRTSAVWRYGANPQSPPAIVRQPLVFQAGKARLLFGGHATCERRCSPSTLPRLAADTYLSAGLDLAAELYASTGGPRALLYTGGRLSFSSAGSAAEQNRYGQLLATATGRVPVYVAPSPADAGADAGAFASAMASQPVPQGTGWSPGNIRAVAAGTSARYAFDTLGPEGQVRVVVIDNAKGSLEGSDPGQTAWLTEVLGAAKAAGIVTVVMGSRPLTAVGQGDDDGDTGRREGEPASDGDTTARLLAEYGASAYVFDSPNQNVVTRVPQGASNSIPAFGSGSLGGSTKGDPGLGLLEIDVAARDGATNRAPVTARIVPVLEDLAVDARDGVEVRRSSPALFTGLGRRPRAGGKLTLTGPRPDAPFVDIPSEACLAGSCDLELDYTFSSSNPEVGDFVRADPTRRGNPRAVFLGTDDKPVTDTRSPLFCAFNPGVTTIRITSGGLSYATQVRVLAGSPRRPCGTRPTTTAPAAGTQAPAPASPPAALPAAVGSSPANLIPPPPVIAAIPAAVVPTPATPVLATPPVAQLPVIPPLPALPPPIAPLATPIVPITPPPVGSVARPSPPGGATVRVYEEKREEEEAFEQSSAAMRYESDAVKGYPNPAMTVALLILAAGAGSTMAKRHRRAGRRPFARQEV